MSGLILVYTLFGDADEARRISCLLVEERLAACANRLASCTSVYEWQGEIQEETEFPVLFKTAPAKRAALMDRLAALHSYDIPAILTWDAGVNTPYSDWAEQQTKA